MALLSEGDAARWHALGGRVAAGVERSLSARVVANRVARGGRDWSLEPVGPALRRVRRAASSLPRGLLLRTDVAAFYPTVSARTLFGALRQLGAERADAATAAALLEGWGSDGYPGLPIGPPASAVMANSVLLPVDRALAGTPFLRWVDDYLVAVRSAGHAEEMLERMDEALHRLGISRSTPKTTVGEGRPRWAGGLAPSAVDDRGGTEAAAVGGR